MIDLWKLIVAHDVISEDPSAVVIIYQEDVPKANMAETLAEGSARKKEDEEKSNERSKLKVGKRRSPKPLHIREVVQTCLVSHVCLKGTKNARCAGGEFSVRSRYRSSLPMP